MYAIALPDRTVIQQQSLANMGQLAQQGLLTRETPVWCEGWTNWVPAGQVPELGPILGSVPIPRMMPSARPAQVPVQTAPAAGPAVQQKSGVLTYLGALILLPLAGIIVYRAWTLWAPPDEARPIPSRPAESPAPSINKAGARVALDNQRLALEAARFRDLASSKLDDALEAYDSPACLGFLRTSKAGREAPQVWAYFFSSSLLLVGHAQYSQPIIAFYHPFLDAALVTRWGWKGEQATITDAALWIGSSFPDGDAPTPEYPLWMDAARKTAFYEALLAGQRTFVDRFDREFPIRPADRRRFPKPGQQAEVQTFIEQHSAAQLMTLIKLRSHRGLADLRKALAEGRASVIDTFIPPDSTFTSATLLKLPRELRERLVPSFALSSAQHTVVALSVPELPRFYILAQFGPAETPLQHLSVQELN